MTHFIPSKTEKLSGWGETHAIDCVTYRPEKSHDLASIVDSHTGSLIARGQGRSYGDASLNPGGVIRTERLNRFLSFDTKKGVITLQSGVTFAEILDVIIPHGWFLPVIPGTKFISVGGAFACNVHGKNHYNSGDIARHTLSITLRLPSNEVKTCSADIDGDIFWATAGGMGLTGIIETVTLQLKKIDSLSLSSHTKKVSSLSGMISCFKKYCDTSDYMIGWIDHFSKGPDIGRGVFEYASHMSQNEGGTPAKDYTPPSSGVTIPTFFPSFVLNKYSMAAYNNLRFLRYSKEWQKERVDFNGFFHPLDNLHYWNRLYGKKGFFQYQFILPESHEVTEQIHELLSYIHSQNLFSFLAVIKYHGAHEGLLSFPIRGYSVALDFPCTPAVIQLQKSLNDKVIQYGGRVYLAKDSLLTSKQFHTMYANDYQEWKSIISRINPNQNIDSHLSQRLQFHGDNQ